MRHVDRPAVVESNLAGQDLLEGGGLIGDGSQEFGLGWSRGDGGDAVASQRGQLAGDAVDVVGAVAREILVEDKQDVHGRIPPTPTR